MAVARLNPANALLEDISGIYADALAEGRITESSRQLWSAS
jgi:putative membrane protein